MRWGVAGNIVVAWLLTLPAAAAIGAATYGFSQPVRRRGGGPGDHLASWESPRPGCMFARRLRQEPLPGVGGLDARQPSSRRRSCWRRSLASLVAGIGVTAVFAILIFGVARSADMVRDERPVLAAAAGGLAVLALLVVAAAIVLGIIVMTSK